MKKSIKETPEKINPEPEKKGVKGFTSNKRGYKENVYDDEQQKAYEKSALSKDDKKNTSGPE